MYQPRWLTGFGWTDDDIPFVRSSHVALNFGKVFLDQSIGGVVIQGLLKRESHLHSTKLTQQWNMYHLKMYFLVKKELSIAIVVFVGVYYTKLSKVLIRW